MTAERRPSARLGTYLLALMLLALPALWELGVSWPFPGSYYLGYGVVGVALLWCWEDFSWSAPTIRSALLLVAVLAVLHFTPWNSRKVFLTRFAEVEPGMTVQAVDALLGPFVYSESQAGDRDTERAYRHQPVGHYDSDVGVVHFRDGLVAETRFTPD